MPLLAQEEEQPNCDPQLGAIDLEKCDSAREDIFKEHTKAKSCMTGPCCRHEMEPCSTSLAQYVASHTRIAQGDRQFCERFLRDDYAFVNLHLPHSVSRTDVNQYLGEVLTSGDGSGDVHPWAARIDINNDGKLELVTWVYLYSGAGQGCDLEFYVELDTAGKQIRRNGTSPMLRARQCGDRFRAIDYRGKVYLEKRKTLLLPSGYIDFVEEVNIVQDQSKRTVCQFVYKGDRGS